MHKPPKKPWSYFVIYFILQHPERAAFYSGLQLLKETHSLSTHEEAQRV